MRKITIEKPRGEWLSKTGAERLAESIRRYWSGKGHPEVKVHIEPTCVSTECGLITYYTISSNIVELGLLGK